MLHVRLRPGPAPGAAGGADPPHAACPLAAPAVALATAAGAGGGRARVLPSTDGRVLLPAAAVRVPVADHVRVRAAGAGDVPAGLRP